MNHEQASLRAAWLRAEIERHNTLYYEQAAPEISDRDFDLLLEELISLEKSYPDLLTPDSPTQRVGGSVSKDFAQVRHDTPMLSLSNTYSEEELAEFDQRVGKALNEPYEYVCELKYDGVAIGLHYENGLLVCAVTRGDGM